jgi:hypothetical protein
MKQDSAMKLCDDGAIAGAEAKRLVEPNQRAPLEAPEFAADLYRNEIGSVRILWDREVARHFTTSRTREIVSLHIVPYAVNTCLAHGL